MNNLQIAKVVHEATRALATSSGSTEENKSWEELTEDERSTKASEVNGLASDVNQGAAPTATSEGISTNDEPLKNAIKRGIVEAFCTREQELAQGKNKHEESVREAMNTADQGFAQHDREKPSINEE